MSAEQYCIMCGHISHHMCQRCRESYCSPQCQITDWPKHKVICIPMPSLVPRTPRNAINSRLERTSSNTSLNSSLRRPHPAHAEGRPHNDSSSRMIREKEPIVPKNPIDLSMADETSQSPKIEIVDNEKAVVDDQEINDLLDNMTINGRKQEAKGWRNLMEYPKDFFEVAVQYVNEVDNHAFVMEQKYEQHAVKLLRSINRQINANSPALCSDEIVVGGLYAAPFEGVFYRAEVVGVIKEKGMASIRLVDYGNEYDCKFTELKAAIPIMKNLNSYGISIRPKTKLKLQTDDVILIKIVDKADSSGNFLAEVRNNATPAKIVISEPVSPLSFILERCLIDCFISYIFTEKNAALATFHDNKVGDALKAMSKKLENEGEVLQQVQAGQYLAFKTKLYGWQRGIIKAVQGDKYFTVYSLDYGFIEVISKTECFKAIPEEFAAIPMQTVLINLSSKILEEKSTTAEFKIKPLNGATVADNCLEGFLKTNKDIDYDRILIKPWIGNFFEYNVAFNADDLVRITRVVSFSAVYLTLSSETTPLEIFKEIAKKSKPIEKPDSEMVLFPMSDEFARGRISKTLSNTECLCLNVDDGTEYIVALKDIRCANTFIRTLPILTKKMNLAYLMSMKSPYENNKAFTVLERQMNDNYVFILKYVQDAEGSDAGVELLFKDKNCLNKQLLPLIFEKVELETSNTPKAHEKNIPDIPQDVMKTETEPFLNVNDIELIPLTTGENIAVMVIDSSTLSTGYFSAFDPKLSAEHMKNYAAKYDNMIVSYAARKDIGSEYCPKVNEVCLAIFEDDGLWYRCFCVERFEDDMFLLIFLDYGNYIKSHKSKIRKLSKELMFPSNANSCIIQGFDRSPALIKQLEEKVIAGQLITLKTVVANDKDYIVSLA